MSYYQLFKSYLSNRTFKSRICNETSTFYLIHFGVPQGSVLGPSLYIIYTFDLPTTHHTLTGTFADDTVIRSQNETPEIASAPLQDHLNFIQDWVKKWKIMINETTSSQVTLTLKKKKCLHQQCSNTRLTIDKLFGNTLRQQVKLETAHHQKKKTGRN